VLWKLVRNRKLAGFKFRRQHPWGRFLLDFYCHEAKLGIELDGSQHGLDEQEAWDAMRTSIIERDGIRVLRFWNRTVLNHPEVVMRTIYDALTDATGQPWSAACAPQCPHPGPLPEGEGESWWRGPETGHIERGRRATSC